jgi:SPP1 family predicted phage head-tail adaptor
MSLFKINPGKYRHIVMFQRLINANDSWGETPPEEEQNWEDVLKARVGIFPISGKDVFTAEFVNSEISHRIQMRYNPTLKIDSSMRIKFGNRIFNIISPPINYQEKNVELQFLCREVVITDGDIQS